MTLLTEAMSGLGSALLPVVAELSPLVVRGNSAEHSKLKPDWPTQAMAWRNSRNRDRRALGNGCPSACAETRRTGAAGV